jgi:uncharacterized protein (TIGR03546 family)
MFILTFIRKLYKTLSRDASPASIAFAVSFGVLAGCVPVDPRYSGLALFLFLLILVFRIQVSTFLFAWGLTRLACVAGLARVFEGVGDALLQPETLHGFWTWACNLPVVAWFGLHRPAVLGGAVVGFLLGAALFVPVRLTIIAYRRFAHEKLSQNKFFRWLTNFWVVKVLKFVFVGSSP